MAWPCWRTAAAHFGLLRDHAPSETRAVRLLMSAYDMDVPKHLAAEGGAPSQFKIEQEVNSLVADSGLQADLARWAVNVWSAALSGAHRRRGIARGRDGGITGSGRPLGRQFDMG